MQQPRNFLPQEVPARFADQLREMRDAGDLRLNAVLASARSQGWRTATLAAVLNTTSTACSKRIERAEPQSKDAVARNSLMIAYDKMLGAGRADLAAALTRMAEAPDPAAQLEAAAQLLVGLEPETRPVRTARRAIDRARSYVQPSRADISDVEIPVPPQRPAATMKGKQLTPEEIDELTQMMATAKKLNGATPAELNGKKHPLRQASEDFSARLNDLITKRGFTPYYLARVLNVTHRAITSRLERHGYREPCPSVRGTPSGVYRGHKIGEKAA